MRKQRSGKYINLPLRDSLKGWHCRWFYISNPDPVLPAYIGRPPGLEVSWNSFPSDEEMKDVMLLLVRVEAVKIIDRLSGMAVVRDFIERRIQPIKEQHHPAFEDSGREDPTRESTSLWVPRALVKRAKVSTPLLTGGALRIGGGGGNPPPVIGGVGGAGPAAPAFRPAAETGRAPPASPPLVPIERSAQRAAKRSALPSWVLEP